MAIEIFCNLEKQQKEPYASGNTAVLSLPASPLGSQGYICRLPHAICRMLFMSHATETCELDSPVCKLSRALMLLSQRQHVLYHTAPA